MPMAPTTIGSSNNVSLSAGNSLTCLKGPPPSRRCSPYQLPPYYSYRPVVPPPTGPISALPAKDAASAQSSQTQMHLPQSILNFSREITETVGSAKDATSARSADYAASAMAEGVTSAGPGDISANWSFPGCIPACGGGLPRSGVGIVDVSMYRRVAGCVPALGGGLPCPRVGKDDVSMNRSITRHDPAFGSCLSSLGYVGLGVSSMNRSFTGITGITGCAPASGSAVRCIGNSSPGRFSLAPSRDPNRFVCPGSHLSSSTPMAPVVIVYRTTEKGIKEQLWITVKSFIHIRGSGLPYTTDTA